MTNKNEIIEVKATVVNDEVPTLKPVKYDLDNEIIKEMKDQGLKIKKDKALSVQIIDYLEAESKKSVINDTKDKEGYSNAKKIMGYAKSLKVGVDKKRAALKKDALEYSRSVESKAQELIKPLKAIEEDQRAKIRVIDEEKARIKKEEQEKKARLIAERVTFLASFNSVVTFDDASKWTNEEYIAKVKVAKADFEQAEKKRKEEEAAKAKAEEEAKKRAEEQAKKEAELKAREEELLRKEKELKEKEEEEKRKEELEKAKEQAKREAIKQQKKKEAELKAKAEEKAKKAEEKAARLEELKPDKQKMIDFMNKMQETEQPEFKSEEYDCIMKKFLLKFHKVVEQTNEEINNI